MSAIVRRKNYSYEDFETPFICSIKQEARSQSVFTDVIANEGREISFLNPVSNKIKKVALSDFEKMNKDIVLLLDAEHKKYEKLTQITQYEWTSL